MAVLKELEVKMLFQFSLGFFKEEYGTQVYVWVVYLRTWLQGVGGSVQMRWEDEEESWYN